MKSNDESLIFLVGFMGAGKSSVGRAMAELIGFDFLDLDEIIESRAGKTISAIFAEDGEQAFRRMEREAIIDCGRRKRTVIALGGGAYISEENRDAVRRLGKSVWLDCPLDICLKRTAGDNSRPLLKGEAEMRRLYESRLPFYLLADFVVKSIDESIEETARCIVEMLGEEWQRIS
ncbi:MAG: shikimate kinase [Acidobacteriota bacterium]